MLQLSSTALYCGRAKPPRTAALRRGRTFKGAEPMRRVLLLFLWAEPAVPPTGRQRRRAKPGLTATFGWPAAGPESAGARLASPIARRIGSPPAKPASLGLASGFGGAA